MREKYESLAVGVLRDLAKARGLKGVSRLKKEELENIAKTTASEEASLKENRNALAAQLDERTLNAYERIRASVRNHLAVVSIFEENACGGCFNTIIPQRLIDIASMKKLVICEHCGRIIVSPEMGK